MHRRAVRDEECWQDAHRLKKWLRATPQEWLEAIVRRGSEPLPLLDQAFDLQGRLNGGSLCDPRLELGKCRPGFEVDLVITGPVQDHEQIRIGDRERLARQIGLL